MKKKRIISLLLIFILCHTAKSQNNIRLPFADEGLPVIQNFSPDDYQAFPQNWSMVQDSRGVVYIANNHGILEYDGVSWRKISNNDGRVVRSLGIDSNDRIYVGTQGNLGYLAPDSIGQLAFVSLLDHIPEDKRDFADVWRVIPAKEGIFFNTFKHTFLWTEDKANNGKMAVWTSESEDFHIAFGVNNDFYVRQYGIGLTKFVNDTFQLVPGGEIFAKMGAWTLLPFGDESSSQLLAGTFRDGLFLFDGTTFSPFPVDPFVEKFLAEKQLYQGTRLSNGNFAFATLRGGVLIMNQKGEFQQVLNKATGVRDEFVINAKTDNQEGLWLTLGNGITRVGTPAPWSFFDQTMGVNSGILTIIRSEGRLYVGTDLGVSYLESPSATNPLPTFKPVSGINGQTWHLVETEGSLLAASGQGVFEIKGDKARLIQKFNAQYLKPSTYHPNLVFVGLKDGLVILRKINGRWKFSPALPKMTQGVFHIEEEDAEILWIGTKYDGVIRIEFSDLGASLADWISEKKLPNPLIEHFDSEKGLRTKGSTYMMHLNDKLSFRTSKGTYQYDSKTKSFSLDSSLGSIMIDSTFKADQFGKDWDGSVWVAFDDGVVHKLRKLKRLENQQYIWDSIPFLRTSRIGNFCQAIYPDPLQPGVVWFGGNDGLLRFDQRISKNYRKTYKALVRRIIANGDSIIYGGKETEGLNNKLPYSLNALRFEYAAVFFDDPDQSQYQIRLEGFDEKWSAWTSETRKDYTNLPEGKYTFKVRAKNVYQHEGEVGEFSFSISPPWYRTIWAYILYGLLIFSLFITGAILYGKWRNQKLEAENIRLEGIVQEKTQEILDTQDQLIMQEKMASLGQMTTGIAHELKNPLNFVTNFAEGSSDMADELWEGLEPYKGTIKDEDFGLFQEILEDIKQNSDEIKTSGQRADKIITSMMNHSGQTSSERESLNMNKLIEDYLELAQLGYQAQVEGFKPEIILNLDPDLPNSEGVPQDLGRVLINLMDNAIYTIEQKKMKSGDDYSPQLHISSESTGKEIILKVRDNGMGIPAEKRSEIFNPFFTTKPTGQGNTGLGLSISHDIITQGHNGKILVESKEGEFTEFQIRLPV